MVSFYPQRTLVSSTVVVWQAASAVSGTNQTTSSLKSTIMVLEAVAQLNNGQNEKI